jgi:hypothetical protein
MIDYIKEYCDISSMTEPLYDRDSDTWDLMSETSENNYFPYETDDVVHLQFESKAEAEETYNEAIWELVNE